MCAFLVLVFGIGFWWSMPGQDNVSTAKKEIQPIDTEYDIHELVKEEEIPGLKQTEIVPDQDMEVIYGIQDDKESGGLVLKDTGKEGKEPADEKIKGKVTISTETKQKEDPVARVFKSAPSRVEKKNETVQSTVKRITEYWIQSGSYTRMSKAENQSEKLKEHGFKAQIKTREIKGVTYYRVRIGPYSQKKEAEKFLSWLKVLDGMQDSYISQVYRNKTIN